MQKNTIIYVLGLTVLSLVLMEAYASDRVTIVDHTRFNEYRILATSKTSTMEKELNQAANDGWVFVNIDVGVTKFGGRELVTIMGRVREEPHNKVFEYKLLATSKTSTMEKELNQTANRGFYFRGQTVGETSFGGEEIVVIMEKRAN